MKSGTLLGVIAVVAVVIGGLYAATSLGFLTPAGGQVTSFSINQPAGQPASTTTKLGLCQGINTLSLSTAVRDSLNSSTSYLASGLRAIPAGARVPVATATGTAGSALSYATLSIPCNEQAFGGSVYAVVDSTRNSGVATYSISGTAGSQIIDASIGDELRITMRDSTLANTSAAQALSPTETVTTAMNSGDSRNGYLDVFAGNDAFTQYGTNGVDGYGIIYILDTVDSAAFTDNGFAFASQTGGYTLTEMSCSDPRVAKASSVDSGNRCWVGRAINTRDAFIRFAWTMVADGGTNPGATSDPIMYIEDANYIEDTDGSIKFGAYDSSGTGAGQSRSVITFDNS